MKSRFLTNDETKRLLSIVLPTRDKNLLLFGLYTGFRISELLSLTYRDLKDRRIVVERKNMKGRQVSRSVVMHAAIQEIYHTLPATGKLFPISRQHADRILKSAAEQAGIPRCSFHSLRKTFGQRVYELTNKDVVAAQRALGHKSLSSTSHYLSIGQEEVDTAIMSL